MKEVFGKPPYVINVSKKTRFITIPHQVTTEGRHYSLDPSSPRTVVTRMDTSKSGWTPYVYYTTLYSTPRYANLKSGEIRVKDNNVQGKELDTGFSTKVQ